MPVDCEGNRADIVMDPNATISRMNLGRLYEQYINGASRQVRKRISEKIPLDKINTASDDEINAVFDYLLGYYKIVSSKMHSWFLDGTYKGTKRDHLREVIKKGIYLYIPPESQEEKSNIVRHLEAHYPQPYGPVTYVGNSGVKCKTKLPVRIASIYIMLLEKTGDDWSAVSSGVLQHFGVLAPIPKSMRHYRPSRNQAVRVMGETEVRILASYVGPEITADIHDRSNSVKSHEAVVYSILTAEKPTDIPCAVNRKEIPLGNSRPLQLVKHLGNCAGWEFRYKKSPK